MFVLGTSCVELCLLLFFVLLSGTEGKSIDRQVDVWFGVEKQVKKLTRTSDEKLMSTNIR